MKTKNSNIKAIMVCVLMTGCTSHQTKIIPDTGKISTTLKSNILHLSYGKNNHWYQDISIIDKTSTIIHFNKDFKDNNKFELTCSGGKAQGNGNYPYNKIIRQRFCHIDKLNNQGYYSRVKTIWLKRNDTKIKTTEGIDTARNLSIYLKNINRELYPEIYSQQVNVDAEFAAEREKIHMRKKLNK